MGLSCNVGHIEAPRNLGASRLWANENLTIFSRELALGILKESWLDELLLVCPFRSLCDGRLKTAVKIGKTST